MIDRPHICIRGIRQINAAASGQHGLGVNDFSQVAEMRPHWALAGATLADGVLSVTMFTGTVLRTIRSKSRYRTSERAAKAPILFASIASIG
jgi:hypothetical protein